MSTKVSPAYAPFLKPLEVTLFCMHGTWNNAGDLVLSVNSKSHRLAIEDSRPEAKQYGWIRAQKYVINLTGHPWANSLQVS